VIFLQAGFAVLGVVAGAVLILFFGKAGSRSEEDASSKLSNETGVFNALGFENPADDENASANAHEPDAYLQCLDEE
jgi:hypothetical protein